MITRRLIALATLAVIACTASSCGSKRAVLKSDSRKLVSYDPSGGYGTYLGNGSIGIRLHSEGVGFSDGQPLQCLMAGFYKGEELMPLPNFSDLPIYLGEKVDEEKKFTLDPKGFYEQVLDLERGVLRTTCRLRQGRRAMDVETRVRVDKNSDAVYITRKLMPRFSGTVTVRNGFHAPQKGLTVLSKSPYGSTGYKITCRIDGQPDTVSMAALYSGSQTQISGRKAADAMAVDVTINVEKNTAEEISKRVIISRSDSVSEPRTASSGWDYLPRDTTRVMDKAGRPRIKIEGDPQAQQAVNSCLFYLLQSVRPGTDYSIPPMGLSSDAWHGHVFWDADIWMFPSLLPLYPELAKSIIDYRLKTLPGAKLNAAKRGLKGAEFAWESARTGLETIGMPYREERHITSDVALAQWQYYTATQDRKWLASSGYPIITACADYWVSRVKYNPVKDQYEILNVVGPDEDADIVNNNAYTNASAARTLEIAAEASRLLGKPVKKEWMTVAKKMYIPFDKANNRYVEYDGFNRKMTKQADTELLIYPLEHPMPQDVLVNTFDYWAKKVNPRGPAMSSSVHAVIAARLGRSEEAYRYFTDSYKPFFRGPFNYFNEKRPETYENMCFLTGAAGPIQAVIYGFCGLRYDANGQISVKPNLPSKWKRVTLYGVYAAGKRYDIVVKNGEKPVIKQSASGDEIPKGKAE